MAQAGRSERDRKVALKPLVELHVKDVPDFCVHNVPLEQGLVLDVLDVLINQ